MLLNYQQFGQGPPIFILHGLFGSLDNWKTVGKELAKEYQVHLLDLRNHGRSFHSDQFNYQVMAADIHTLAEELDLQNISVIGHSMGGKAAMFYADLNPGKLKKLIVVDIAPRYYEVHHQQILEGLSAIDLDSISSRSEADKQLRQFVEDPGVRQFLLKNLQRNGSNSFGWKINLPVIRDQIERVGEGLPSASVIEVPTLFLRGANSDYVTERDIDQINTQFPNATITTVEEAGHWIHAEAPDKLMAEVRKFIN